MWIADGFDDCILGHAEGRAIYCRDKMIEKLMLDGMTRDEAEEYFEYNVVGGSMFEGCPLYLERCGMDEIQEMAKEQLLEQLESPEQ